MIFSILCSFRTTRSNQDVLRISRQRRSCRLIAWNFPTRMHLTQRAFLSVWTFHRQLIGGFRNFLLPPLALKTCIFLLRHNRSRIHLIRHWCEHFAPAEFSHTRNSPSEVRSPERFPKPFSKRAMLLLKQSSNMSQMFLRHNRRGENLFARLS